MTVLNRNMCSRNLAFVAAAMLMMLGLMMLGGGVSAAESDKIDYALASLQLAKQGEIVLGNGDTSGAKMLYEQAIVADPKNADAYVGLGRVHITLEKRAFGLKYFAIALEIQPTNLGALEGEALAYLSGDEVAEAEKALTKIRRICAADGCAEDKSVTDAIAGYLEEHVAEDNG